MPIEVIVVPTRKKRINVIHEPAFWQKYLDFAPNEEKHKAQLKT